MTLPPEIHYKFFNALDRVGSVCLGLTCKEFYKIHGKKKIRVRLWEQCDTPLLSPDGFALHVLLQDWIPPGLTYGDMFFFGKFVGRERYQKEKDRHLLEIAKYFQCTPMEERLEIMSSRRSISSRRTV